MKFKLITLFVCLFSLVIVKGQSAASSDLSTQIGKVISVCGIIKDVHLENPTSQSGIIVTIEGDTPNNPIPVLVTYKVKKQMDFTFESLKGKKVCFSGKVKKNNDKLVVTVVNTSDITEGK